MEILDNIYSKYPYELHDFQKRSAEAIVSGKHVLVTAHTGMGKTVPAEIAIHHFVDAAKPDLADIDVAGDIITGNAAKPHKVIYTAPIKAISNQKKEDFQKKFGFDIGIITGDITLNVDADVIIMTTEILKNILELKENNARNININEFACIIYDEVHYFGDRDRGYVWESAIIMTPPHIQLVMLSATISNAPRFASWIEKITSREVVITGSETRLVPLYHYTYTTCPNLRDTNLQKRCQKKLILLKSKTFQETGFLRTKSIKDELFRENVNASKSLVINEWLQFAYTHKAKVENGGLIFEEAETAHENLFPAIYFVFSQKQTETLARSVNMSLFEDDSKFCYDTERRCREILSRLPNMEEYMNNPEFKSNLQLWQRGVAFHHSGVLSIFRELVEILYVEGRIKLLFATETFSSGINLPVKMVMFDSLEKYDNSGKRYLLPQEVTQMAGRAGRFGKDNFGLIVHMSNNMKLPLMEEYKEMLNGSPQSLTSKFRLTYNNLLCNEDITGFLRKTLLFHDNETHIANLREQLSMLRSESCTGPSFATSEIPREVIEDYIEREKKGGNARKKLATYEKQYPSIKSCILGFTKAEKHKSEITKLENEIESLSCEAFIAAPRIILEENNFFSDPIKVTIARSMNEIHPLAITDFLLATNFFEEYSSEDICELVSTFIDVKKEEGLPDQLPPMVQTLEQLYNRYTDMENRLKLDMGIKPLNMQFIGTIRSWCKVSNEQEAIEIISSSGLPTGDFRKAIMKIHTITNEFITLAETMGKIAFLEKLHKIPSLIMKYIICNNSLYI